MARGIFMTFILILIFSALVMYSFEVVSTYSSARAIPLQETYHLGMLSYYDDVGTDLSDMYGLQYSQLVLQNGTLYKFSLAQRTSVSSPSSKYRNYVRDVFQNITQRNISLSFSNLTLNITCGDGLFVRKNFSANDTILFLNTSSLSNASITLNVSAPLTSSQPWPSSGSLPVHLRVISGGTENVNTVFYLSKAVLNRYTLNYSGQIIYIDFGNVGTGTEGIRIWGSRTYIADIAVLQNATQSAARPCYFGGTQLNASSAAINVTGQIPVPTYR